MFCQFGNSPPFVYAEGGLFFISHALGTNILIHYCHIKILLVDVRNTCDAVPAQTLE